ncbi:hypothetical protein [Planomonospora venezuelensis]|uniref:Uncharacterized protein n=1 Tax=Planomonospora venezuelensis TaxID=1999 RepID=A0A841DCS9_PLAVE|nr:hypothetical protein [Planomonospora venezuelensis]MBB5966098.1 hypothetical protein [Planomonospora venezuelensis]GIN03590.1 hypothetical protein Pve01_52480 [Planomonospora venezuelensis]
MGRARRFQIWAVTAAAVLAAAAALFAVAGTGGTVVVFGGASGDGSEGGHGREEAERLEVCSPWVVSGRRFAETRFADRERAFLCHATAEPGIPPLFGTVREDEVLAHGKRLCGVMHLRTEDPRVKAELDRTGNGPYWRTGMLDALVYLCPDLVARHGPDRLRPGTELLREEKEHRGRVAARCPDRWRGPRPRSRITVAAFTGEGGEFTVGDVGGEWGREIPSVGGLIEAYEHVVRVRAYDQNDYVCVTTMDFAETPPLLPRGWSRIVEAGLRSTGDRIEVVGSEGGPGTANLGAAGPGDYRIRIYARDLPDRGLEDLESPGSEYLVLAFPGRLNGTVIHRP